MINFFQIQKFGLPNSNLEMGGLITTEDGIEVVNEHNNWYLIQFVANNQVFIREAGLVNGQFFLSDGTGISSGAVTGWFPLFENQ